MTAPTPPYSDHAPVPISHPGGDVDIDVRKFLLMLWRRKLVILLTMLIFVGGVFLIVDRIAPRYNAKASVLIESNISASGELRSFVSSMRIDNSVILSEAEVLKSRTMARKVITALDLMNDPEFNPYVRVQTPGLFAKLSGETKPAQQGFKPLSVYNSNTNSKQNSLDPVMGIVVDNFLKQIRVRPIPGSFVLQVEFNSTNPSKAALIVNKIVDSYIEQNVNLKLKTTQRITAWLDTRLNTLRSQVRDSEDALEAFKRENNIENAMAVTDVDDFVEQQRTGLGNQLVLAKSTEAQAQARLDQIQDWMKNPSKIKMTDEAVNSRVLQTLKLQEASQIQTINELAARYGPKHPLMMDAELALSETRDQMRQELRNIAKNIQSNLEIAQNSVAQMQNTVEGISGVEGAVGNQVERMSVDVSIRLRELMREKEASETILDAFLQTYKRAADQGKLQESQARIISYATSPTESYHPNQPLFISLAIIASFFVGLALVLLFEKMVNAYRTAEELEQDTGLNCLGLVPLVAKMDSNKPVADYILNKDGARVAESIRTLRMVLNLRAQSHDQKSKVVSITSALPDEGKTTLSAWMARTSAKSGERVIIIDCDLRRPRLHDAFGKVPQNTLVEYLTGKCTLEEALYRDPGTNMHAIFGRAVPNNALDLLSKDRMNNLIEALKEQYDLIVLDCPACLSVSDSRLLASKSDQTIFAVAWNETPREVVNVGVKQFADFGYDALTLVLTHVDLKQYAKYGFNDAIHYYSAYNPYYEDH